MEFRDGDGDLIQLVDGIADWIEGEVVPTISIWLRQDHVMFDDRSEVSRLHAAIGR